MGVTTGPGCTEFTRIRSLAYCTAVSFVRSRTAPFDAWYCGLLSSIPTRPSCDEMLTIDPPPARRRAGMAALVPRKTPLAFTSITRSHSAAVVSSSRPAPPTPALLTSTSSFPKRRSAVATARSQSLSLVTSSLTNTASPPLAPIPAATAAPSASRMSPMTIRAPSCAKSRASTAPIPRAPPLIRATLPASLIAASLLGPMSRRCPATVYAVSVPRPRPLRRGLYSRRDHLQIRRRQSHQSLVDPPHVRGGRPSQARARRRQGLRLHAGQSRDRTATGRAGRREARARERRAPPARLHAERRPSEGPRGGGRTSASGHRAPLHRQSRHHDGRRGRGAQHRSEGAARPRR